MNGYAQMAQSPVILIGGAAATALRDGARSRTSTSSPSSNRWSSGQNLCAGSQIWPKIAVDSPQPDPGKIVKVAAKLAEAKHPVMLVGSQATLDAAEIEQVMDAQLGDKTILVADGGDLVATASYILNPRGPLTWLDPGAFGTLGVGAGFALGAKLAHPDADVWNIYGDGSAGYSLIEFDTFVRHRIPVVAVVGNDAGWTQIARDQVEILGDDVGRTVLPTRTTNGPRRNRLQARRSRAGV